MAVFIRAALLVLSPAFVGAQLELGDALKGRIEASLESIGGEVSFVEADGTATSFVEQVEGGSGVIRFVTNHEGFANYGFEVRMEHIDLENSKVIIRMAAYDTDFGRRYQDTVGTYPLRGNVLVPTSTGWMEIETGWIEIETVLYAVGALSDAIRNQPPR